MENNVENPFEGIIELKWPGKYCKLEFTDGKWRLIPYDKIESKRALIFDKSIGIGDKKLGYVIKGDAISAIQSLRPYVNSSVQFVYFDAPRLDKFQTYAESGYGSSTWLSLIQQVSGQAISLLSRNGFFALHTDERTAHYARVVLDEVFGQSRYVGTFAWQKQYSPQNDLNVPTDVFDYITVYSKKSVEELDKIGILVTPKDLKDDGDFRGCYIDGHKEARSGSEATKFKVNTSPYRWEIIESSLPEGNYHFDSVLGVLWFESVNSVGDYHVRVKAIDKRGSSAERTINFSVREQASIDDEYSLPNKIWWLLKDDNEIAKGGEVQVADLTSEELDAIKGQQFSLVFKAQGGEPFTMRSDSPGSGRYWEFGLRTLVEGISQAKASFGDTGNALPSIKKYFNRDNAKKRQAIMNFLPWYDFGHTQDATQHCKTLKNAGITEGDVNMMAKPQKLLGYLISLFAPRHNDIVMSIGDSNAVFASVAIKLHRNFIHVTGGSEDDLGTWLSTASRRLVATMQKLDNSEMEGNDYLPDSNPENGYIHVLKLSKSKLLYDTRNGNIEPEFSDDETVEDFYAGLSGGYRQSSQDMVYQGLDKRLVYVVPCEESLDAVMLDKIKCQYPDENLTIIYETSDEQLTTPRKIILKRAPFELI